MKNPNEIKYKTNRLDDEGNPIYITEEEFREHGIYTLQEDETVDENGNVVKVEKPEKQEEPKKRFSIRGFIGAVLVSIITLCFMFPIIFGLIQLLMVGILTFSIPNQTGEAIGIVIITSGALLLILGFAILMGYSKYKKRIRFGYFSSSTNKNKDHNDLSGRYVTTSYKRPNGQTVTYVRKDKD